MRRLLCALLLLIASPALAAERILALSPHACEMLFAIGAGAQVVGGVEYCDYPEAAAALPRVGGYRRINPELALALAPTLAVAIDRPLPGIGELERLGVRVEVSYPESVDGMLAELRRLGRLTGHAAEGSAVATSLERELGALPRPARRWRIFYEVWSEPLMTAGGRGWVGDLIRRAGGNNIFGHLEQETPRVSLESVIRAAPEVVVIPSEKRDVEARKRFWRQWLGDGVRFVTLDPDLMHRPTPRGLQGLRQLAAALAALE